MAAISLVSVMLVAVGGAVGSVLRYLTSVAALEWLGAAFPWGTLAVNAIGSLVIGAMAGADVEGSARLLLVTGVLGGFTTFSAFSLEVANMIERGSIGTAALYAVVSVVGSVAALFIGLALARGFA